MTWQSRKASGSLITGSSPAWRRSSDWITAAALKARYVPEGPRKRRTAYPFRSRGIVFPAIVIPPGRIATRAPGMPRAGSPGRATDRPAVEDPEESYPPVDAVGVGIVLDVGEDRRLRCDLRNGERRPVRRDAVEGGAPEARRVEPVDRKRIRMEIGGPGGRATGPVG